MWFALLVAMDQHAIHVLKAHVSNNNVTVLGHRPGGP